MFELIVVLVVAAPLLAALANGVNALVGDRYSWRVVQRLATGAIFVSFLGTLWVVAQVLVDSTPREVVLYRWLASGTLTVDVAFLIDALSAVMMLVTTGISFLIAVFSINYMHNERGFSRYFAIMPLFVFAMLVLVMSNNYILLFLGWEGVGVCSYLLIGFYYDRKAAAQAGTKAFVMNRVGDAGFLIGIFLIITSFGTTNYTPVFAGAASLDTATATAIGLCLLLGAVGKSAQLPLATWLARAMEGPTPSSALIHAATMVTAGVYMIARSHELYDRAPDALLVVAVVGTATAVFGAVAGLVQTDIKSLLAYSTTSQLGLMFLACGVGAYTIAIFHLAAHAVFKTLLFLTAPSILHHLHGGADVRDTAPARETAPAVYRIFLLSAVGLAVFPFLSRWWQGELLGRAVADGRPLLLAFGVLAVFTAAVSTARLVQISFRQHAHAAPAKAPSPPSRRIANALVALTVIVVAGWSLGVLPGGTPGTWFQEFLAPVVGVESAVLPANPVLLGVLAALIVVMLAVGWFTPLYFDRFAPERAGVLLFKRRRLYNLALNRFWLDELYAAAVVQPVWNVGRWLGRVDSELIDRATGVPAVPGKTRSALPAWEEQRLATHALRSGEQAPGVAWREGAREGMAQPSGVFGWLTQAGAETGSWIEREGIGHVTGVFGWLTQAGAEMGNWIEREGIGRVTGALGWTTEAIANVSAWVEREIVNRTETLVVTLTHAIARISQSLEGFVFHTGIHVGMPQATGRVGQFLNTTEEILGRPAVIGSLVFLSFVALLLATL